MYLLRCALYRGEEVSRPVDDVLFEIAQLADQGVREINLLGPKRKRISWPDILMAVSVHLQNYCVLVASIDGIDRLRLPPAIQSIYRRYY